MPEVISFEPMVITAVRLKPPTINYVEEARPPVFKVTNIAGAALAGLLWWTGWKKTSVFVASMHALDIVARQASPYYAKRTEAMADYRRVLRDRPVLGRR